MTLEEERTELTNLRADVDKLTIELSYPTAGKRDEAHALRTKYEDQLRRLAWKNWMARRIPYFLLMVFATELLPDVPAKRVVQVFGFAVGFVGILWAGLQIASAVDQWKRTIGEWRGALMTIRSAVEHQDSLSPATTAPQDAGHQN